jgi:histidine triad (HIT) family protein
MTKGHTLVVPKVEVDYLFDLDPQVLAEMTVFAQKVANGIKAAMPCKRVGVAVLGMEVPHAHIHLVPINKESDLDFRKEKLKLSPEEFADIAKAIAENIK